MGSCIASLPLYIGENTRLVATSEMNHKGLRGGVGATGRSERRQRDKRVQSLHVFFVLASLLQKDSRASAGHATAGSTLANARPRKPY